uniref:Uncharacterized protein n=1 Tax=Tetraselmis sp. GSL018 TaxID=582737 RepID=A0A061R4D4_9CHLO|mmetsp:Transcript_26383/g.62677  ORF Transcript_26383/g.62677 Transcript_26383/m.62677 type:complete len:224 (+) Transcript_26383:154-825(+)
MRGDIELFRLSVTLFFVVPGYQCLRRNLLQTSIESPFLPDVLASQNGQWSCVGNTCQRKTVSYDDMWLFYKMFYNPPPPPSPPPPEKELVIKRVYGCHDDDDDPIYCSAVDRRIKAAMSNIEYLSQTSAVRRVPSLHRSSPPPNFSDQLQRNVRMDSQVATPSESLLRDVQGDIAAQARRTNAMISPMDTQSQGGSGRENPTLSFTVRVPETNQRENSPPGRA